MRFIDAHTHLSDVAFIEDFTAVRERYLSAGVIAAVDSGATGRRVKARLICPKSFPKYILPRASPENAASGGDIDEIIPLLDE